MDTQKIALAANSINKPEGIKISDIVNKLGLVSDKNTNREASIALVSLGWKRSDKKVSDEEGRGYLWFSPVITTVPVQSDELETLKQERAQFLRERNELQRQLEKTKIELQQYKSRVDEDLQRMREEASEASNYVSDPMTKFKDSFKKNKEVIADDFDTKISRALGFSSLHNTL